MGRPRKYKIGYKLGSNKHTLIEYVGTIKGKFICGICGKEFIGVLSEVSYNRKTSCGCLRSKYKEGDILGENSHTLIKRIDGQNAIFKCGICGKEFECRINSIVSNNKKSCGCLNNLIGRKFGKLTVVEYTGRTNTQKAKLWLCKCDCGNFCEVSTGNLQSGHTQSCGCLRDESYKEKAKAWIGKRFGKLTIVQDTNKRTKNGNRIWLCKCDCGNFCEVSTGHLTSGHNVSCGCINSKYELIIKNILDELNISYEKEKIFLDCTSVKNSPLRFDFYLPNYNCCIEYDGIQHYKPIEYFGGEDRFIEQQKNDLIKDNYCKDNNIRLIRISYIKTEEEIRAILKQELSH